MAFRTNTLFFWDAVVSQIKAGLGMNMLCLVTLFILFPTLGSWIYGLDVFPPEAAHIGFQSRL